jgi:type VI secretion system VasI/ImpG family protein
MKEGFLEYYRSNLEHLRELSAEFARQYPKIASRLDMTQHETRDPFVERLLEGAAFLSARVEQKFDDGYPLFLQSLLLKLCPLLAVPQPAATVLELKKRGSAAGTVKFAPDSAFEVPAGVSNRKARFTPVWEEKLIPGQITDAAYKPSLEDELSADELKARRFRSALKLTCAFPGIEDSESWLPDDLDIYLNMPDSDASELSCALGHSLEGVYLQGGGKTLKIDGIVPRLRLFSEKHSIFDRALRIMPGVAALPLFFAWPFLLHFITFRGLGRALRRFGAGEVSVLLCFDRELPLVRTVRAESVRFNCAPAVNLFKFRSDRVRLGMQREFLCEIVRTEPLNFEIYSLNSLEIFDQGNRPVATARPFYSLRGVPEHEGEAVFFSLRRAKRLSGLYQRRSSYVKTDAFVALSGGGYSSADPRFAEFSAEGWATNADLPLFVKPGAVFSSSDGACEGIAVTSLAEPQEPLMMSGDIDGFNKLSYVMLNLSAFIFEDGECCQNVLRQLAGAYFRGEGDERRSLQDAIFKVQSRPEVFRFVQRGCVYYEKGYELEITLDEQELTGVGIYAYGRVLSEAVRDYSPVNLLVRITLCGREKGRICQWDPENA